MEIRALINGSTLALIMAGTPTIVSGQNACFAYAPLRASMQENGVRLQGYGRFVGSDVVIEVWVSPEGEWAAFAVGPDGIACIALSGEGWGKPEGL